MTRQLGTKAAANLLKQSFAAKQATLSHTEALDILARLQGYQAWSHLQQDKKKSAPGAKKPSKESSVKASKKAGSQAPNKLKSLAEVLAEHYGRSASHPMAPRQDWAYEVENGDTSQGYWDWVVDHLVSRELYVGPLEFHTSHRCEVTKSDGSASTWNLEHNLTDRWGSFNPYAQDGKPGLAIMLLDEELTSQLREQMWDEQTFVVRKDGEFGTLFELEFCSQESELDPDEADDNAPEDSAHKFKPHAQVVESLRKVIGKLEQEFPEVQMCIPDPSFIVNDRPAIWAFAKLGAITPQRAADLGLALCSA